MEFRIATEQDKESIFKFIQENYYPYEPLNKSLHRMPESITGAPFLKRLEDNVSLIALKDNQICGVSINAIIKADKLKKHAIELHRGTAYEKILTFLDEVDREANVWSHIKDNQALEILILNVKASERRQKIAKRLLEASLELAKANHIQYSYVGCSSHYSAAVAKECGYHTIYSILYDDYKVDGNVVFKTQEPHKMYSILLKIIQ